MEWGEVALGCGRVRGPAMLSKASLFPEQGKWGRRTAARALRRPPSGRRWRPHVQKFTATGMPNLYAKPARRSLVGTRLAALAELVATLTKPAVARLV